MDSQVPEILVVVQVFVVDGGEAALVGDVAVGRNKRVSQGFICSTGICTNTSTRPLEAQREEWMIKCDVLLTKRALEAYVWRF